MKVLLYEPIHPAGMEVLRQRAEVVLAPDTSEDEILKCVADVDGIVIRAYGAVSARIMDAAPQLKVIGRHGVGVDNVDVEAATERGIWVVNTPKASRDAVAEHVVGMMLSLAKHMLTADAALRDGCWGARHHPAGMQLYGKTLGIIGLGNIGYRTAEICRQAFAMEILYYDRVDRREAEQNLGARPTDLPELLASSDFISLHVPLVPETEHLIGVEQLALMKPTAYLINTARGGVVDDEALVGALRAGKIAGAGLDVFEGEFTSKHLPVFELNNVIVTPHMAAHTEEALRLMSLVAEDIVRVLAGQAPQYPVNTLG